MLKRVSFALISLAAVHAAAPAAALPAPLAQALELPESAEPATYELSVESDGRRVTAAIDPTAPRGADIRLISVAPDAPRERVLSDLRREFAAEIGGDIWCDSLRKQVPHDVEVVAETATRAEYRFQPRSDVADNATERDLLAGATSHMVVERENADQRWRVTSLDMRVNRPFRVNLVTEITALHIAIRCATAHELGGRTYHQTIDIVTQGRALFAPFRDQQRVHVAAVRRR